MNGFILNELVFVVNEQPMTSSFMVAKYFGKLHKNVMRDIDNVIQQVGGDFARLNFELCYKINELQNGKPQPYYKITKDGFTLLVMGYTGQQAMKFKISYIKAFNEMAEALVKRQNSLQAQYHHARLQFELASAKASEAGRTLAVLGKQVKPAYQLEIEKILHEMNPQLEFDKFI